ncbi:NlpB/DapX lipoprotein domain protein [Burkholderia sp. WAC0059]|uniref:outer membrane protein assembly factor BamC n=1 Tax=Burkholderia sp. WAC0059 TaxID=2066022 RepID=UPI000C7EF08B|nr:outer membrane protein assembly factor BamC [Burkholderia sp. WAC0059]PLZ02538.1 NlpB/DapX lipoprotein domain protein [Burkholderia sp. WAC0059]
MSNLHQRLATRAAVFLMAGGLVAGCSTPSTTGQVDYRSDSKVQQASLTAPPNMLDENADQRSLPPQGGATSLSALQQVQATAPAPDENTVLPSVPGMHIQRDGTESWLVIDGRAPAQVWPAVRRFWIEQGFLLVVDQRNDGVMETDWNETHPQINDGIIRNTLTWATGNSYMTAERNKYRTRLESAPNGGTYVFISQKGLRQQLTGLNNESTTWVAKPNDPGLEMEYLKRLMTTLANAKPGVPDVQIADAAVAASAAKATPGDDPARAAEAAQNAALSAQQTAAAAPAPADPTGASGDDYSSTEMTLGASYDDVWQRVGTALNNANFTVDNSDHARGIYYIRYVDPKDMSSDTQGFWSQVVHGHKDKVAKQYRLNVRALTETQTRVAVVDESGKVDTSRPAQEIMALVEGQLQQ